MCVEIDGIKVYDESQAQAMFTQGFISDDKLSTILKDLGNKPFLADLADNANRNKPITFVGQIIKRVQEKLKKD